MCCCCTAEQYGEDRAVNGRIVGGDQPVGGTMLICPPPLVAQCDAHRSGLYAPLPALYARLTNHPNHAHIYKPSFTNSGSWAKFQFQIQRDTNTSFNNGNVEQKIDNK